MAECQKVDKRYHVCDNDCKKEQILGSLDVVGSTPTPPARGV